MLQKFFGRAKPVHAVLPRTPPDTRVYAIGDIHGRLDLLRAIHQLIHEDAYVHQARRNVAVYLGDYIDRGDTSSAVLDCLLDEPLPGFQSVHLLGNHEDSLLQFLTDPGIGPAWLSYGGIATLHSYGVRPPASDRELPRVQEELRVKLPERHLAFLRGLALQHIEGDYAFVHAGYRPGVPLAAQVPQDLLWIRDDFLSSNADFGKIVVHGHTIAEQPDVRRNRIGIDTGAFASGTLTSLVLADDKWSFLQT